MSILQTRINRLLAEFTENAPDAIALVPGANMYYFFGLEFHLSERPVIAFILHDGRFAFIIPKLEASKLDSNPELSDAIRFVWDDESGYMGAFEQAASTLGLRGGVLAVDDMTMRVFEWMALSQTAPGLHVASAGQTLLHVRAIKAADEVDALRAAVQLSEKALAETLESVEIGMTERQIGRLVAERLTANGAQGESFQPLVQIGEKSALPHGFSADRQLADGDILLIDFGGLYQGYPADITRTIVWGQPTEQVKAMHAAVLRANEAARAAAKPGMTCGELDKIARDEIESAGLGKYFIHRTGHGLGLEIHELPNIVSGSDVVLETGMVFTIEPGVYIPGVGGIRIEDNVVITETGCDALTSFPRQLTV